MTASAATTGSATAKKAPAKTANLTVDMFSATGAKAGTLKLPASLFAAPINEGLMHQALVMQQSNRRPVVAKAKTRGEVTASTRKLFQQKGTGRARRGSNKSPLLRGGGKAFGPQSNRNFTKNMPKKMRQAALKSCLSLQAQAGGILGLDGFGADVSTKKANDMLSKMPIELGRNITIVMPEKMSELTLSVRNIPGVKTVLVNYLNPEDVLNAKHVIFLKDSVQKAEVLFGDLSSKNPVNPKSDSSASLDALDSSESPKK